MRAAGTRINGEPRRRGHTRRRDRWPLKAITQFADFVVVPDHDEYDAARPVIMENEFAGLDRLNIRLHGDAREKDLWATVAIPLSNYELFWRTLIVLLTNRVVAQVPATDPEWIRLRTTIPSEYERLAMENYSLLYFMAMARRAIEDDRQRLKAGSHPQPERIFFYLMAAVDHAKRLQTRSRRILFDLGIQPKLPKHPEHVYDRARLYRDAFTHDPLLGRAVAHRRELLPPTNWLREARKKNEPLLWRDTAAIPPMK